MKPASEDLIEDIFKSLKPKESKFGEAYTFAMLLCKATLINEHIQSKILQLNQGDEAPTKKEILRAQALETLHQKKGGIINPRSIQEQTVEVEEDQITLTTSITNEWGTMLRDGVMKAQQILKILADGSTFVQRTLGEYDGFEGTDPIGETTIRGLTTTPGTHFKLTQPSLGENDTGLTKDPEDLFLGMRIIQGMNRNMALLEKLETPITLIAAFQKQMEKALKAIDPKLLKKAKTPKPFPRSQTPPSKPQSHPSAQPPFRIQGSG